MSQRKEVPPGTNRGDSKGTKPTTRDSTPTGDFDFDQRIVAQVDKGIWEALFDGDFRLAVACDICGRWVTSAASKRNHRGPRCAAKAGAAK